MPALRGRSSQQDDDSEFESRSSFVSSWTNSAEQSLVATMAEAPSDIVEGHSLSDTGLFEFEQEAFPLRQSKGNRKKPADHIPRPPNAFILFRSSFIKNRHVSTEVETNHSTLSKIIGMTWQNLPDGERQKWHARAKSAQDEHKRKFPQYAFRPVHNKAKGPAADRRKLREVGPKDTKRCAKIAELLVCGKKGQELEEAIQEFDKHHVPEIVTRFDTPITANTYLSPASPGIRRTSRSLSPLPSFSKRGTPPARSKPAPQSHTSTPPPTQLTLDTPHSNPPSDAPSFDYSNSQPNLPPSFDFNSFAFTVQQPSPPLVDNCAAADTHTFSSFNSLPQDSSHLCQNAQYTMGMEEWPQHNSPLSNGTCSMPSTPANMTVPFPDSFAAFSNDAGPEYAPLDGSYRDYPQYTYYAPAAVPGYENKQPSALAFAQQFDSGGLDSLSPLVGPGDEHAFSSFMASLQQQPPVHYSVGSDHLSYHSGDTEMNHP